MTWCRLAVFLLAPCQLHAQGTGIGSLPPPTGQLSVGRTLFRWIDESLPDPDLPDRRREIIVWAWYPAAGTPNGQPAEWMPGKWAEAFAAVHINEDHVGSILSHAYADAAPDTSRRYPVLLFAAGLGDSPLDYTTVIEDVVSHGYIVLGVVSPEFGRARVFSDGRVFPGHDPAEWAVRRGRPTSAEAVWRAFEQTRIYSRDLRFALTRLANVEAGPLKRSADFGRIGTFGHSLGGAAAIRCAYDDSRVRAVFDIDGSPIWSSANGAVQKPLLVLSASDASARYDSVLAGATPGRHLRLAGTDHAFSKDFRSTPRLLRVTAALAEAFFDQYLNGKSERLLDGPTADYPEVSFESVAAQPRTPH